MMKQNYFIVSKKSLSLQSYHNYFTTPSTTLIASCSAVFDRWAYLWVILGFECPSSCCTWYSDTPLFTSRLAVVCLRSCSLICGRFAFVLILFQWWWNPFRGCFVLGAGNRYIFDTLGIDSIRFSSFIDIGMVLLLPDFDSGIVHIL